MNEEIDLFEHMDKLPVLVRNVLNKYENAESYTDLHKMGKELKQLGYSFDWGLDAIPYNLKQLN